MADISKRSWISLLLVTVVIGLLPVGCYGGASETGILTGRVTIGPIWPVEPPGATPTIPAEVYSARKVMVYDKDVSRLVEKIDLGPDGHYRVELKAGSYVVDINYLGVDSSPDVPRSIEIKAGETVRVNIDIDTGIR